MRGFFVFLFGNVRIFAILHNMINRTTAGFKNKPVERF